MIILDHVSLNADMTLADCPAINVGPEGLLWFQALIDNGAGAAPTDTPVGVWLLYFSTDGGARYTPVTDAAVTAQLATIAAVGNTLVNAWARFSRAAPGLAKLIYDRTSGGAGDSRATISVGTR